MRSAGRVEHDNNFDVVMGLGKVWYVVAGPDMAGPLADIGRRSEAALQLSERLTLWPRMSSFPK